MLLTNHVVSGALIGALTRRPLPAFAAGVASHFILDAVPHWGDWGSRRQFLRVAAADGLVSLAVAWALAAASPPERRPVVLAGMAGAALPDLDKPAKLWFGWSPFPAAVDRFHSAIQREAWHRGYVEVVAAATLAPAALTALRGSALFPRAGTAQWCVDSYSGRRTDGLLRRGPARPSVRVRSTFARCSMSAPRF